MKNRFQTMIKRIALLGMSVFLLAGAWAQEPVRAPFLASADDRQCRQWVDSVMSRMNLHEKIGQLLSVKGQCKRRRFLPQRFFRQIEHELLPRRPL